MARRPAVASPQSHGPGTVPRAAQRETTPLHRQPRRLFAALLGLLGAAGLLAAPDPAKGCAPTAPVPTEHTSDARATPAPTAPGNGCGPARPGRPGQGSLRPPLIAPDPGQPWVAARTSTLTGSTVTATGLRVEGTVQLLTADGTLRALKVSMTQAVTDDVLLRAPGPSGRTMRFTADRLTMQGDVALYATRFAGRLSGATVTLGPDLPLPERFAAGSSGPVTFTEPAIDLVFLRADALTASPRLELSLPRE
ncbi:hypothetical protein ACSNN7_00180 [Micromonospora sp. URMC 105]|uniref:hypothetical protein n=1 Tax=Micromonospora sp. URMC 105 TaxID=3423413 RepID=UPI003F195CCB